MFLFNTELDGGRRYNYFTLHNCASAVNIMRCGVHFTEQGVADQFHVCDEYQTGRGVIKEITLYGQVCVCVCVCV